MAKNTFDKFTNLYSLTKTLRFELKPTAETRPLTEIIKEDQEIDRLYQKEMKPMFDNLHEKFITESLQEANLPLVLLDKIEKDFLQLHELKKAANANRDKILALEDKKDGEMAQAQKDLREVIVELFNSKGKDWKEKEYADIKLKNDGYTVLTEERMLEILAQENPDKKEIIEKFKRFFTYFSGFNQNRANYYSQETKKTGIASRIIDENLFRFLDDRRDFQIISKIIPELKDYKKYFELTNYQDCLTQEGIENFNLVIGEINKKANLFSQQNKGILPRAPKFKNLYKQIGCGKSKFTMLIIEDGEEWQKMEELINSKEEERNSQLQLTQKAGKVYQKFFTTLDEFELDKIYFNKSSINAISSFWFASWHQLADLLKSKKIIKNKDKNTGDYVIPNKISLADLKEALASEKDSSSLFKRGKISESESKKENPQGEYERLFEDNAWDTFLKIWSYEISKNFESLEKHLQEFNSLKQNKFDKKLHTSFIKEFCDAFLAIEKMIKYHKVQEENPTDDIFYEIIDEYLQESKLNRYYDAFRNHLSQKPFDGNKIKLNFENGSLLGGWSDGQERNKGAVILRNKNHFYLGILKNRSFFRSDKDNPIYIDKSDWGRLILKNLKFQTLAGKGFLGKYVQSYGEMGKEDPMKAVSLLQEFIKSNYASKYPTLKEIPEKQYDDKKVFDADIKAALAQAFDMRFRPIDEEKLSDGVKNSDLYLFKITNKDLSNLEKPGKMNIHTLYWLELFSEENLKKPQIALNGGGEVFFRKGQREKLLTKIVNGKEVLDAKRYADDKVFLHTPITINYGKPKNIKFKKLLNEKIAVRPQDITVLGIDRGEKNLLYYSLINHRGEIIKQGSLNKICCGDRLVDYNALLSQRAEEMKSARQSWEAIGKIKDLKEGYLSQVVHEIYKIVIEHNAIIVLEDLNTEFKAKRTAKVEKSVYKKFELALAKKLNHLILKDKEPGEQGGVLNAYQLTPAIEAGKVSQFEKSKQWGIMLYVRPDYTSTTDPLTGWRKELYLPNSLTDAKAKEEWKKNRIKILFDPDKNCFKFCYDKWELCAYDGLDRFYWKRNEKNASGGMGAMKKYDLHGEFEKFFADIDRKTDIDGQLDKKKNFKWSSLIFYWNLLNQIRNSDKSKEDNGSDFIQSPVWSDKIKGFYDSRRTKEYDISLPDNGDANGAYNIARKGIMLLDRIKENPEKPDLYIKNSDWDTESQNQ